jgi:hypothetical protein
MHLKASQIGDFLGPRSSMREKVPLIRECLVWTRIFAGKIHLPAFWMSFSRLSMSRTQLTGDCRLKMTIVTFVAGKRFESQQYLILGWLKN